MHFHPRLTAGWPQPSARVRGEIFAIIFGQCHHICSCKNKVCLFVFHSFPLLLSQWRNIQQRDKKKIQKYLCMYIYIYVYIYIHAQSLQSCLTLWDPIVYSLPGSSFHGVLQTRILEWVVTPSSRGSSRPRDGTHVSMSPVLAGDFFTTKTTWEEHLGDTHTHTHTHIW